MNNISAEIKTNLSKAFFEFDDDEENFYDWMNSEANKSLFSIRFTDEPQGVEGITKLEAVVDEFTDDHDINIIIEVNSNTVDSRDDALLANDALFDYLDKEFVPKFIEYFNNLEIKVKFPFSSDNDFSNIRFDGENFYTKIYYSESGNSYTSAPVKDGSLILVNDFEVYI